MDYSSLIPSFDKLIPEFLAKENHLLLVVSKTTETTTELEEALKSEGFSVRILEEEGSKDTFAQDKETCGSTPCVAVFMTPADTTLPLVQNAVSAGIDKIWLDVGSESSETISFLQDVSIPFVYGRPLVREAVNKTPHESEAHKQEQQEDTGVES